MSKKIGYDKSVYRKVCSEHDMPVFFQDWWLDATCLGGEWKVLYYLEDPNVVAVYTYFEKRKGPFQYVSMPWLTRFMGPLFLKDFSERKKQKILQKLIDHLPNYDGFEQALHYEIQNWLPFKWAGYEQTVAYSYVLDDVSNLDHVRAGMDVDYRNNKLRKAESRFTIKVNSNVSELWHLFQAPFMRQNIKMPLSRSFLMSLIEISSERGQGTILSAVDVNGVPHACCFIVWDQETAYLLMTGENPTQERSEAVVYVVWKAIEYASSLKGCNRFDFLGGMQQRLERTRRQFGASQNAYFLVTRKRLLFKILQKIRSN